MYESPTRINTGQLYDVQHPSVHLLRDQEMQFFSLVFVALACVAGASSNVLPRQTSCIAASCSTTKPCCTDYTCLTLPLGLGSVSDYTGIDEVHLSDGTIILRHASPTSVSFLEAYAAPRCPACLLRPWGLLHSILASWMVAALVETSVSLVVLQESSAFPAA